MPKPTFFNLPAPKRDRIIQAAVQEFGARPYAQATLDRIVEAAGISKGSMYQYFGGKSDLYSWLITSHLGERKLAAIGAAAPPPDATVWQVLEQAFLAGVRMSAAEPGLTRMGARFLRDHEQEPELAALWEQNRAMSDAWMRALLSAGRERGELRPDVDLELLIAFITHALGEGMLELIARRLGVSLARYLEEPERIAQLTEEQLLELVSGVTRLLRDGAG